MNGSTHKGKLRQVLGGVGRNLCEGLQRLGHDPFFITALGDDALAPLVMARFPRSLNSSGIKYVKKGDTATYCALLDHRGECLFGVGDMDIHEHISPNQVELHSKIISEAPLIMLDGNVPIETITYVLKLAYENNIPVWYEPTDINKAKKPFINEQWKNLSFISPNIKELNQIYMTVTGKEPLIYEKEKDTLDDLLEQSITMAKPLLEYINTVIVTLGDKGVLMLRNDFQYNGCFPSKGNIIQTGNGKTTGIYYPIMSSSQVINVSGSGDCLAAAVASGILKQICLETSIQAGLKSAALSVSSYYTVPDNLTSDVFTSENYINGSPKLIHL